MGGRQEGGEQGAEGGDVIDVSQALTHKSLYSKKNVTDSEMRVCMGSAPGPARDFVCPRLSGLITGKRTLKQRGNSPFGGLGGGGGV